MLTLETHTDAMVRLGRAMSDPTRSRILAQLLDGPHRPGELASELGLSKQSVSNHLSCLRGCGLVQTEPEGRVVLYRIADPHLAQALSEVLRVTLAVAGGESCCGESCTLDGCGEAAA